MSLPRAMLQLHLNALEDVLPELIRCFPDPAEFWPKLAGYADAITDVAGAADAEWVHDSLDTMPRHHDIPEAS